MPGEERAQSTSGEGVAAEVERRVELDGSVTMPSILDVDAQRRPRAVRRPVVALDRLERRDVQRLLVRAAEHP
jgi:hypothetical protein